MCGIAGIYQQKGQAVSLELVEVMGSAMTHRGPDSFNVAARGHIGFAHNRLSLLDLSAAANQPFENDDYVLVYNGEIYNFREIRERLTAQFGVEFKTVSDTEVLFYSLIYQGIDRCLSELRGMFAFAFYDKRADELWLARDRMGIKPLYYYRRQTKFYWSSEIKAIVVALDLKPDLTRTLFAISGNAERSREATIFRGVQTLKPGSYLKVAPGCEPRETIYYRAIDDFDEDYYRELSKQSATAVLADFEKLLVNSIESALISDAPLGAFVSGGIDSSLIAAIARRKNPEIKLFTANVIGKHSEYEDARALATHINSEIYDYKFEPQEMLANWADATYFYECPIIVHTNAIPFAKVAELAHAHGVKAVLTGEGADELFLGYPRLLTKNYNNLAMLPVTLVKSIYKLVPKLDDYLFPDQNQTPVQFVNQLVQNFELPREIRASEEKLDSWSRARREKQYPTIHMLGEHLTTLLHRNDRMGMRASIEARFPFLNEELVRFAINLPTRYKIAASARWHNFKHPFLIDKWIVRKIAEKFLPKRIVQKKKNGFPMSGHKNVRVEQQFFENGWLSENLELNGKALKFLVESQNPYFVAKLASIEIFARLFDYKESSEVVTRHILKYARMSG